MVETDRATGRTSRRAETDTTWSATQVGPRGVKSGLGGHDDGVFGVAEGVEKSSLMLSKHDRKAQLDHGTLQ